MDSTTADGKRTRILGLLLAAAAATFPARVHAQNESYNTVTVTCSNNKNPGDDPSKIPAFLKAIFTNHQLIGHELLGLFSTTGAYLAFGPSGIGNSPVKAGFYAVPAAVSVELAKEYATEGNQGCSDVHGAGFWIGTGAALTGIVLANTSFIGSSGSSLPGRKNLRDAQRDSRQGFLPPARPASEEAGFKTALRDAVPLYRVASRGGGRRGAHQDDEIRVSWLVQP